jgi:hypothetical protein
VQLNLDAESSKLKFLITANQLIGFPTTVSKCPSFLFVSHGGDSSQKLRVDAQTACLFRPMDKNRPRPLRSESDSDGNASAPFQGVHRTTPIGHPQRG